MDSATVGAVCWTLARERELELRLKSMKVRGGAGLTLCPAY